MRPAAADARNEAWWLRGGGAEKGKVERKLLPDECEKENERSPAQRRKPECPQQRPEPVHLVSSPDGAAAREASPDDPQAIARLAQLSAEAEGSEAFDAFARDLCARYLAAWRGARRMLSQHLESPGDVEPTQAHPAEPSDADICCYFARLQSSQAQAGKWHTQALKFDPSCVAALLALADDHRRAERFGEAARLYRAAQQQRQLPVRSLYRLGEVLVQSGRGSEGRRHLRRVLQETEHAHSSYQVHAAVTMALSYAMDQRHESALQSCLKAEDLHEQLGLGSRKGQGREMRLARTLRGLTQLRTGDLDAAVETLRADAGEASARGPAGRSAAEESGWHWDEMVQSLLGYAETLRGNYAQAECHLGSAFRLVEASSPGADVFVSAACLRQAQGDLDAAKDLVQRALQVDRNSPNALLRMGYLLLCQGQFDKAAQFLQKCLQQPFGTLAYGSAEKGAAHMYLCLALHWRSREWARGQAPHSPGERGEGDELAQDHFRLAYELQPDLRRALLALQGTRFESNEAAAALLVEGSPPRMGIVDLTLKQTLVCLFYAEECGVVRLTRRRRSSARPSPSKPAGSPLKEASPSSASARASASNLRRPVDFGAGKPPPPAGVCGGSLASTLAATASTATPTSVGSSRASSELVTLFPDASAAEAVLPEDLLMALQELSERLPPRKVLPWSDVVLDKCMSRGEFAIVNRGRSKSLQREVVVKMMHQKDCMYNDQAARDLLAEIRILSELCHPRVVEFVGACLEPTHVALVTELAPGGNLHQALHVRRHPFPLGERFSLAAELLEGVRYLHMQRPAIAHLDLKSTNLVLDAEWRHLRICDFGLAREMRQDADGELQDPPPSQGGSARYMAPECYDSNLGPITEKADVWSSGCILIEIFGSCLPYAECNNVQQILKNMLVHRCGPSIPASIEVNVRGAIAYTFSFEVRERLTVPQVLVLLQTAAISAESRARLSRGA